MKKIKVLLVVFVFIFSQCFCLAIQDFEGIKDGDMLSLEDCINIALEHSPEIQKYKNKKLMLEKQVGQAKSEYYPTLGLTTGYFADKNINNNSNISSSYQLKLSANQLIWDFGKTIAKINMRKYNLEAADYDLQNEILTTILTVRARYYEALTRVAEYYIAVRSVKIDEINVERTKALYEAGLKSEIDLVNAEVNLTKSQSAKVRAYSNYIGAFYSLNKALYLKEAPIFRLASVADFDIREDYVEDTNKDTNFYLQNNDGDEILTSGIKVTNILKDYDYKAYPKTVEECLDIGENQNPSLMSLKLAKEVAKESYKVVKRGYLPSITGSAGYGYTFKEKDGANNISANASLSWSGLNAKAIKNYVDEAKINIEYAQNNIDSRSSLLHYTIRDIYGYVYSFSLLIPLKRKEVEQTLENFKLADGRYSVGLADFIELQEAHNAYNKAQLEYVELICEYNLALIELEEAMGVIQQ